MNNNSRSLYLLSTLVHFLAKPFCRPTKLTIVIVLFTTSYTFSDSHQAESFEIIATPYPPFVYENNLEKGYSSNLIMQVLADFNHPYQFYIAPPARAQIRASEYDHLITFLPPIVNEQDYLRYEELEKSLNYKLFQRLPAQFDWNALNSRSVGYLNLNSGSDYLNAFNEAGAEITIIPNFTSGLKMLMAGRLDFIVGIDFSIMEVAKQLNIEDQIVANKSALSSYSMLSFYVNQRHALAAQLNAYLQQQTVVKLRPVKL